MICSSTIPTLKKDICSCGSTYPFLVVRDFLITAWNLGPYQEYRCSYCGNQALLSIKDGRFLVAKIERPAFIVGLGATK